MSTSEQGTAALIAGVPSLAAGVFAALGLALRPGPPSDGRDPSRPLVPDSSLGVSANLLGTDGRVAGRLVIAATAEAAAVLIGDGGPSEALVAAIADQLRRLAPPADGLLPDRFTTSDGAAALAGVSRQGDPLPVVVPLDSDGRHLATVAVALTADAVTAAPTAADLPPLVPPAPPAPPTPQPTSLPPRGLSTIGEVQLAVSVELGRTELPLRELLGLQPGAVVELDRSLTEPVDVYANGTLIARGEMVVVDDAYGVRITELVEGDA